MQSTSFENFELRLKELKEDSQELYSEAERYFSEHYREKLSAIMPEDALGIHKTLSGVFILAYADTKNTHAPLSQRDIFSQSLKYAISSLPIHPSYKSRLGEWIVSEVFSEGTLSFSRGSSLKNDPIAPLLDEIFQDGILSKDELILLEESYHPEIPFQESLNTLPLASRKKLHSELGEFALGNKSERLQAFEQEYHPILQSLSSRWYNIYPVMRFVSQNYYKRKSQYESPERRLKRTWKMALLRLLRYKFGSFDVEKVLAQFENCQSFEDFFLFFLRLFEILWEKSQNPEVYQTLEISEDVQDILCRASENTAKIRENEKRTQKITQILAESDAEFEQQDIELIMDEGSHFHGNELQIWEDAKMAGVYAQAIAQTEDEEENQADQYDLSESIEENYERLKNRFFALDEEKRQAFAHGNYDCIDLLNIRLAEIESRLDKITKILKIDV